MIEAETIIKIVSDYYKIPVSEIFSKSRKRKVKTPRHMMILLLRDNTKLTLNEISEKMIGGKKRRQDHTTLVHASMAIKNLIDTECDTYRDWQIMQTTIDDVNKQILCEMKIEIERARKQLIELEARRTAKLATIKPIVRGKAEAKIARLETLSPADEVRRKYL